METHATPSGWQALPVFRLALESSGGSVFETQRSALYNLGRNFVPDGPSNSDSSKPRRWTIFAAGLLLLALGLVVLYTNNRAFSSPLAVVVVAAIGLAALLIQLRLRKDLGTPVHAPVWLNVLGLLCALAAVFADRLHFSASLMQVAALGAVVCFAVSGVVVLRALRKKKI
jgi:amino acid transporter